MVTFRGAEVFNSLLGACQTPELESWGSPPVCARQVTGGTRAEPGALRPTPLLRVWDGWAYSSLGGRGGGLGSVKKTKLLGMRLALDW